MAVSFQPSTVSFTNCFCLFVCVSISFVVVWQIYQLAKEWDGCDPYDWLLPSLVCSGDQLLTARNNILIPRGIHTRPRYNQIIAILHGTLSCLSSSLWDATFGSRFFASHISISGEWEEQHNIQDPPGCSHAWYLFWSGLLKGHLLVSSTQGDLFPLFLSDHASPAPHTQHTAHTC